MDTAERGEKLERLDDWKRRAGERLEALRKDQWEQDDSRAKLSALQEQREERQARKAEQEQEQLEKPPAAHRPTRASPARARGHAGELASAFPKPGRFAHERQKPHSAQAALERQRGRPLSGAPGRPQRTTSRHAMHARENWQYLLVI